MRTASFAARQRIDDGVARRPDNVALIQLASRVYRANGDLARSETSLRRALDLEPGNVGTTLLLVESLTVQSRREEAMRLLEGLLQRQPASVPAQTALGILLEQMGRINEAHERYEKIIADNPGAGVAAARLALLYVDRKENLDVALAFMNEAKRSMASDPDVSDALGWVYLNKNLVTFALPHLEDAVRASPRNALFQYHLGIGYIRGGQPEKARQALTRATTLDHTFSDRQELRDALARLPK